MFCYLRSQFFSNERQTLVDVRGGGEELGGVDRGETVIRIYYTGKDYILNKRVESVSV